MWLHVLNRPQSQLAPSSARVCKTKESNFLNIPFLAVILQTTSKMHVLMKTRYYLLSLAFAVIACQKPELPEVPVDNDPQFVMTAPVTQLDEATKVIYTDNIIGPFNPGADPAEANKILLKWRAGDELVAIRWDPEKQYKEWAVLRAQESQDPARSHEMIFSSIETHFTQLVEGERFVLVHGDFVLDPDRSGNYNDPRIDFPISEIAIDYQDGYIHHGGTISGNKITFQGQDGTLENLRKHEYMVSDAYVHIVEKEDGKKEVVLYSTTEEEGGQTIYNPVTMSSAHTLLRWTLLIPNTDFEGGDNNLFALSLTEVNKEAIFPRYYRMHPSAVNEGNNYYMTDYNNDKEKNPYFRVNLPEEGWDHTTENVLHSQTFDPTKLVSVASGDAHYVTAYVSIPAKTVGKDLVVSFFTRTHVYRTQKTYKINPEPGKVYPLNVSFASNDPLKIKAITDPKLRMTFSPGLVYATRLNTGVNEWTYGIYQNQGEYAGLNQQTDVMGDYFIFGSIDPRQVFHQHKISEGNYSNCSFWNPSWRVAANLTSENDVAAKVTVGGKNNIFSTMTKAEAERVWARVTEEAKNGVNKGFYYYDAKDHDTDALHHTAHQAVGAHCNLPENDERRLMSSTMGIWIGIDRQPTLAEQDMYVFLPSSHQLNNSIANMQWYDSTLHEWFQDEEETSEEAGYENVESYRYAASADYGKQHVYCIGEEEYNKLSSEEQAKFRNIPTRLSGGEDLKHYYLIKTRTVGKAKEYGLEGTEYSSMIMKFSTNTRDIGNSAECQRFQVWYASGKNFHTNSGIGSMSQTFGRVVRPVIY